MRAILTYHSIDPSGSPISVDRETLARHADWLATGPVPVVPLSEIGAVPESRDSIAVTFDDGFASFATDAWPLFSALHLPVTLFVVSGRVGRTNRWSSAEPPGIPELPLLGWDELARLASEGVEIGCHGRTHADLSSLAAARVEEELDTSCDELERRLGARPTSLAYPYGGVSPAALEAARARFARACTTELALLGPDPDPHLLPRLDAWYYRGAGRLEAFGSARFRVHLAVRAGARRMRAALRPRPRVASPLGEEGLP